MERQVVFEKCANLSGLDLRGLDLRGKDFGAVPYWYDIKGWQVTVFVGSDMRDCDMRGCDLSRADLRGVDFRGANLRGANLYRVRYSPSTLWPEGFVLPGDLRFTEEEGPIGTQELYTLYREVEPPQELAYAIIPGSLVAGKFEKGTRVESVCLHLTEEEARGDVKYNEHWEYCLVRVLSCRAAWHENPARQTVYFGTVRLEEMIRKRKFMVKRWNYHPLRPGWEEVEVMA